MQQKRATFVISSLESGGAERILSWIANQMAEIGFQVTIITLFGKDSSIFYELDSRINCKQLNIAGDSSHHFNGLLNNIKRCCILRRVIKESRPDTVISFMDRTNICVLLALIGCNIPVIVSEHTNPDYLQGRMWHLLRRISYPLAHCVVVLTQRTKEKLYFVQTKIRIIPNPVLVISDDRQISPLDIPKPIIFAMGRLVQLKRFDLLLYAFADAHKVYPDWSLMILGEGPERANLESIVVEFGLGGAVKLPGHFKNPECILRHGDLFVLSSQYEGFPNALCEAMACGLAVIATDCPTGPREIIREGIDGLLVPNGDLKALIDAMLKLMSNDGLRKHYASNAPEVCERFSPERIFKLWEEIIGGERQ